MATRRGTEFWGKVAHVLRAVKVDAKQALVGSESPALKAEPLVRAMGIRGAAACLLPHDR